MTFTRPNAQVGDFVWRWRHTVAGLLLPVTLCIGCGRTEPPVAEILFTRTTIDQNPPERPWYKLAGDINNDGLPDIVVAGAKELLVAYLAPDWRKIEIASEGWSGVNGEIADLDDDGDQDIVMGSVIWFRNPGHAGAGWEMVRIASDEVHDIEVADLNGDGRLDIVARNQSAFRRSEEAPGGSIIYIYLQTGIDQWKHQKIDCPHGEGLDLADVDGDGDPDIVIAGRWYENTGTGDPAHWPARFYASGWTEIDAKVAAADINGDGRLDVVLTPSELQRDTYKFAWYEQPANRPTGEWREHVIVPAIETIVHALAVGDLDGDGDADIVYAEMHQGADPDEVVVLLNEAQGERWHKQVLSNDGSHDIAGANHAGTHPLELWRNDLVIAPAANRTEK